MICPGENILIAMNKYFQKGHLLKIIIVKKQTNKTGLRLKNVFKYLL